MNFQLDKIAAKLESLEETIIFRLIDRAQYKANSKTYEENLFAFQSGKGPSLLDHKLRFAEETDAVLGRYTVSEERPFFDDLPPVASSMKSENSEQLIIADFNQINLTKEIKKAYIELLPKITVEGEDREYGTTAELDIATLQAIARRIHFGSFYVAESKYLGNPKEYAELIKAGDREGLMALLTRKEVEDRIIERIVNKVEQIQSISNPEIRRHLVGRVVADFYEQIIIPLTKVGEVAYLLQRNTEV